jgi:hypothetical protein
MTTIWDEITIDLDTLQTGTDKWGKPIDDNDRKLFLASLISLLRIVAESHSTKNDDAPILPAARNIANLIKMNERSNNEPGTNYKIQGGK